MTLETALAILKPAAEIAATASSIGKLFGWLGKKGARSATDPILMAVLAKLPANASAKEIAAALAPLFARDGGDVSIAAGDDGGGSIRMEHPDIAGGDGRTRGGAVAIKAGDGGPNGPGGHVTIVGGKIKGGDAN